MSELEEAIANLGRKSWHGMNVVGGSTDFWPVGMAEFEDHKDKCPIWTLYKELVHAASTVKGVWHRTSKEAKEMLFNAAMEVEKREGRKFLPKEQDERRDDDSKPELQAKGAD